MADINLRAQPLNVFGTVGDDMQIVLTVVDSAGDPIDVSGYTISAKVWRGATEVDEFTDAVSGASNNVITLSLTDTETTAIGTERGLRWSLSMTASSITEQWVGGKFELLNAGHPKASGVSAATLTYTSGNVTVTLGSISTTALDGRYIPAESAASAGGRDVIASPNATTIGTGTDVLTVFGGTTSNPQVVGNDVTLATISGGYDNEVADGDANTIAGGAHHLIDPSSGHGSILGGSTQEVHGAYGVAVGGLQNKAESDYSTVVGGRSNVAGDAANRTTKTDQFIGGGFSNEAEGLYSTVGAGYNHTADAPYSSILGGSGNVISSAANAASCGGGESNLLSAPYSSVPGGIGARPQNHGQMSHAGGFFGANGDAQTSVMVARNQTTDATPTVLYLNGSSLQATLPTNTTWAFTITLVARNTGAQESAGYKFEGVVDRGVSATTTALVGTVTKSVLAEDNSAWDANVTATTAGVLAITVTGAAATTIRWVARIEIVEVQYP